MKPFLLVAFFWVMAAPLWAKEEKRAHHQLAWLGFLNLPARKELGSSKLLPLRDPSFWEAWKSGQGALEWLPQGQGAEAKGKGLPFLPKYHEAYRTRRQWRNSR